MEDVEKTWKRRDGSMASETVRGYKNPATGKIITPDVGWDYNPGKAAYH